MGTLIIKKHVMTKRFKLEAVIIFVLLFISSSSAQSSSDVCYNPNLIKDTTKKSIKSATFAMIGKDSIKINYHSPGVRKRIIWGGLVPFDEVWVTGAHDATSLELPRSISINKTKITAGKYALFTIPGETEWIVIINKKWNQHLASEYDEKEDVVRVKVKPLQVNHIERLQYYIETSDQRSGKIAVVWEKLRIEVPFEY